MYSNDLASVLSLKPMEVIVALSQYVAPMKSMDCIKRYETSDAASWRVNSALSRIGKHG